MHGPAVVDPGKVPWAQKKKPFCSLNNRIVGVAYPYSGEMMKRTPSCESSVSFQIPLMGEFLLYLPI